MHPPVLAYCYGRYMRKFIAIVVLAYVIAHTFYFIYSITHVSYSRREFSKRDLSDGPLVMKEGKVVVNGKIIGSVKRPRPKATKYAKNSKKEKLPEIKAKPSKETPKEQIKPLELDADFVKEFVEEAVKMHAENKLIYLTVVNGAFERLTLNWLCNVAEFEGIHQRLLIVSTSKILCDSVHEEYGEALKCIFLRLPGFEEDLDWGERKYINFLAVRAKMMKILAEHSIRFVLIEADSTWFRDPTDLFRNATLVDDADVVVPIKGDTHKGDIFAFSPMLVEPTNSSVVLLEEMNKRLQGNDSLYDQDVLNELCSVQFRGIVCRNFEYNEIADGKWFYMDDETKSSMKPYVVNNNFYVGIKNKEARQAINGLWFLTKSGHCSAAKVKRARERLLGESN
ncbi:hypothetical protein Y032_0032g2531 [Ancylostoma ceylanicum]|uniref:Nucleotide-diphospho-sugar transferase domain-containing protein n=1 Tax=Ancylostoma ceylanicum TaxID=53326 RepID=A0A016UN80_9BILA|nr:hypothetical protein Y032_0032g2531 [Ancylostoma ceylanicum]